MIWTSCYGHWRWFPEGCIRAAVSLQVPKETSFDIHIKPFAPTWELVQLGKSKEDKIRWTREYLALLDSRESASIAAQKLKELSLKGRKIVLLCWEADHLDCHRRLLAKWIEVGWGMEIPELQKNETVMEEE